MNGLFVFKNAVVRFTEVINECLEKNNLTKDDIDLEIIYWDETDEELNPYHYNNYYIEIHN